nr:hypothetical protein [uncultured Gemmiger sp.]
MGLLQMLIDVLAVSFPRFTAVLLALAAALFGFCAYVFFSTAQWAGGVVFLVMTAAVAVLFFWMLYSGEFRRTSGPKNKKH